MIIFSLVKTNYNYFANRPIIAYIAGKDYWLAAFALAGRASGFSSRIVGTEN
jgi:hypothetical protein